MLPIVWTGRLDISHRVKIDYSTFLCALNENLCYKRSKHFFIFVTKLLYFHVTSQLSVYNTFCLGVLFWRWNFLILPWRQHHAWRAQVYIEPIRPMQNRFSSASHRIALIKCIGSGDAITSEPEQQRAATRDSKICHKTYERRGDFYKYTHCTSTMRPVQHQQYHRRHREIFHVDARFTDILFGYLFVWFFCSVSEGKNKDVFFNSSTLNSSIKRRIVSFLRVEVKKKNEKCAN